MIRGKQKMGERGGGGVMSLSWCARNVPQLRVSLKDQVSRFAAGHLDLSVW